jgi:hypothetical protein
MRHTVYYHILLTLYEQSYLQEQWWTRHAYSGELVHLTKISIAFNQFLCFDARNATH